MYLQKRTMTIYFASDHAGYALKNELLAYVRDTLHYEVVDCGAHALDPNDDYPDFINVAAEAVSDKPVERKAIILGGSGQGEAMAANKFKHVRAAVYYGPSSQAQVDATGMTLDMIASVREHNDANVLSLGARFLLPHEAKNAVRVWLQTPFGGDERHVRRLRKIKAF